jgi:hypothetical protein
MFLSFQSAQYRVARPTTWRFVFLGKTTSINLKYWVRLPGLVLAPIVGLTTLHIYFADEQVKNK